MFPNDPNKPNHFPQPQSQYIQYQFQLEQQQQQNHQKQPPSSVFPQKQTHTTSAKHKHSNINNSAQPNSLYPQINASPNYFKIQDEYQSNEPDKFEKQENSLGLEIKQKKESDLSQNSSGNNSIRICIEDSDAIPSVHLEKSPKGHSFTLVKIPMYRTTTFMKLETQVFLLEVFKSGSLKDYQIERRYSEFVQLYDQIFYNYPGYILAPFPDKGLESFMKIKLGLGTEQPGERNELIEKRMQNLEKFINFVTHHQQLCNSDQAHVFLTAKTEQYEQGKKRLEKYLNENRSLEKRSTMKSIIGAGRSFFTSYFQTQKKQILTQMTFGKNDINLTMIHENIQSSKDKFKQRLKIFQKLYAAEKNFSDFVDFSTENDVLLKVCAKHSSGKNFCSKFADFILIKVLDEYQYNTKQLQQAEKVLEYRKQIWQCLQSSKKEGSEDKKAKLIRRIQMLEINFLSDWQNVNSEIQKRMQLMENDFKIQWKTYKKQMKKIWKTQKTI